MTSLPLPYAAPRPWRIETHRTFLPGRALGPESIVDELMKPILYRLDYSGKYELSQDKIRHFAALEGPKNRQFPRLQEAVFAPPQEGFTTGFSLNRQQKATLKLVLDHARITKA